MNVAIDPRGNVILTLTPADANLVATELELLRETGRFHDEIMPTLGWFADMSEDRLGAKSLSA